jgi:hypothetical protein
LIKPGQALALAAGIVGAGIVFGVRRHLRSENFVLDLRRNATPIGVATKALFYGTVLCFSSFLGTFGAISFVAGVHNFRDLDKALKRKLQPVRDQAKPPPTLVTAEDEEFVRYLEGSDDSSAASSEGGERPELAKRTRFGIGRIA